MNNLLNLTGTGVAIITPFKANGTVDFDALKHVIDFAINGGVNYIVTLGTTGETPTLSISEKHEILKTTVDHVNKRVPIVVGIGGNNTSSIIENLNSYPLEGVEAILSASPHYNKPTQEGLFLHYKAIAENSSKPIILYNVPSRTGKNIDAATTIKLANEVPNIIGIKEASDNITQAMEIVKGCPKDFLIISGDDALSLCQIALGFKGVISVVANSFPRDFCSMINEALKGNFEAARSIHFKYLDVYDLLFKESNPAGIKAFLYELGLIENELRLPLIKATNELQYKIKDALYEINKINNIRL